MNHMNQFDTLLREKNITITALRGISRELMLENKRKGRVISVQWVLLALAIGLNAYSGGWL